MKPLFFFLAAALVLPLKAHANDDHPNCHIGALDGNGGGGGYDKTVDACQTNFKKDVCVKRLIHVLKLCHDYLRDEKAPQPQEDVHAEHPSLQERIAVLSKFAHEHPDIRDDSMNFAKQKRVAIPDELVKEVGLRSQTETASQDQKEELGGALGAGIGEAAGAGGRSGAGKSDGTSANRNDLMRGSAARDLNDGNARGAEMKMDEALKQDQNDAEALTLRSEARAAQGNREGALSDARKALALDPKNKAAGRMADQNAHLERADGIRKKFTKLADGMLHGPDDAGSGAGNNQAAMSNLNGRESASALAASAPGAAGFMTGAGTDSSAVRSPLTMAPLMLAALRKQAVGDYTGALIDISQEIDAHPNDAAALTLRAELDIQLGNYASGISDAGRALAATPDGARALRARSYAEFETKLFKEALADATRAVELDPKSGLGYLYKAMAEDMLGMPGAESDLRQALALDPTLKRLAAPLLRKFNLDSAAAPSADARLKPWMVRGGFVGVAMLLVFMGLIGTQKAKTLRAIRLTPRRAQTDAPGVAAPLVPGSVLGGGYRIVREIGRGGMGVVYEGVDETLQRRVAVKRLLQDAQTLPEDRERFLREARLVAQLKHPNLAQIYAVAVEREPFLVFEYVDGETLDGVLSRSVVLPPAAARKILGEIAGALSYAHAHNIIHRDLKPSNVMIAKNGATKVMDFGIAHQSRTAATQMTRTAACGTPPYMSPEQGMGSVSKASDLYALGVMTYELLTGKRPFEGPNFLDQKLQRLYQPATAANPELPAAIDHFFKVALDPDPTKRPASAEAFMEALGRACDATPRRQASAA